MDGKKNDIVFILAADMTVEAPGHVYGQTPGTQCCRWAGLVVGPHYVCSSSIARREYFPVALGVQRCSCIGRSAVGIDEIEAP